ncbi:hypothetical protein EBESD8_57640 [Rhodococcus aetherivorans]|nr:hypothetical protein EBESD8_57640 [Rhodococcus aetherivorans]
MAEHSRCSADAVPARPRADVRLPRASVRPSPYLRRMRRPISSVPERPAEPPVTETDPAACARGAGRHSRPDGGGGARKRRGIDRGHPTRCIKCVSYKRDIRTGEPASRRSGSAPASPGNCLRHGRFPVAIG